jgi:hypothetical protein
MTNFSISLGKGNDSPGARHRGACIRLRFARPVRRALIVTAREGVVALFGFAARLMARSGGAQAMVGVPAAAPQASNASSIADLRCRPEPDLPYELMFATKTTIVDRLADTVDLLIDFATLGEYGLEPVGRTAPSCEHRGRTAGNGRGQPRRSLDHGVAISR